MRRAFIAVVAVGVLASLAWAAPRQVGGIAGPGALAGKYCGQKGADLLVQCLGRGVWLRPGCSARADGGASCVNDAGPAVDAGPGDLFVEFGGGGGDPFPFPLGANEDCVWARTNDGGLLSCSILAP